MATDVDKADALEKFVAERKLTLGVARVPDVYKLVAASGYPTAFVIDVDGKVIWRGHPQGYTEALALGWLKDLRAPKLPRKVADPVAGAKASYDNGDYGSALVAAERLLKHKDATVRSDATYVFDLLNGRLNMHKAAAEIHQAALRFDRAHEVLAVSAQEFKGLTHAKECTALATKIKSGKAYKDCVASQRELGDLKPHLKGASPADAKKALDRLVKKWPDTAAAQEAQALLAEIR